jgi:hypothetical protein
MLQFLRKLDHLPGGAKNGFVPEFLPEGNIKAPVRESPFHEPRLPFFALIVVHNPKFNDFIH